MPRKGGGLFGEAADIGLWGVAYANSDGSVVGTVENRFYYGFMLLLIIAAPVALFFLFAHTTTPKKEPFETKKVEKRPMFKDYLHKILMQ
jgi:hypothetical protein